MDSSTRRARFRQSCLRRLGLLRAPSLGRSDRGAQVMSVREHACVSHHRNAGRRDKRDELGHELLRRHHHRATAPFNVQTHTTVRQALHRIGRKRRTQQISRQPFKLSSVSAVDSCGRMQVHAERVDVQLRLAPKRCCLWAHSRKPELNGRCNARLDLGLTRVDVLGKAAVAGNGTQHCKGQRSSGLKSSATCPRPRRCAHYWQPPQAGEVRLGRRWGGVANSDLPPDRAVRWRSYPV